MEWVVTMGRTVDEALDAALDQLGVDEQDAEYEVLEEPKTGLFGRIRSEARVRARVRPKRPRSKDEHRRDRSRRRRRSGAPTEETVNPPPQPTRSGPDGMKSEEQGITMDRDVPLTEQAELAREFLTGLLAAFNLQGDLEVREVDEDTVEIAVTGPDLGLLIGPKGSTLTALQEVTRTVVHRRTQAHNGRILVDVGGYREKRRLALERFTRQLATEVKETGVRKVLEPMAPPDRKVVHDTVNEIEGVSTTSEGEEPDRRVVIEPS